MGMSQPHPEPPQVGDLIAFDSRTRHASGDNTTRSARCAGASTSATCPPANPTPGTPVATISPGINLQPPSQLRPVTVSQC